MTALILLRRFWPILAAAVALLALWGWHSNAVGRAYKRGATEQAATDRTRFEAAERAATAAQNALIAKTATNAAAISKGTDDALQRQNDDISRRYDALRKLWAARGADPGSAGQGAATAAAQAAAVADAAACFTSGGLDFQTAATIAEAADRSDAKVNAWINWYQEQEAAWPR